MKEIAKYKIKVEDFKEEIKNLSTMANSNISGGFSGSRNSKLDSSMNYGTSQREISVCGGDNGEFLEGLMFDLQRIYKQIVVL